jgi:hypothetical protein
VHRLVRECRYIIRLRGGYSECFCGHRVLNGGVRSGDPYVAGSNPDVGRGCRSFGWDSVNRGPVLQQVWHVKEPSQSLIKPVSAKHTL